MTVFFCTQNWAGFMNPNPVVFYMYRLETLQDNRQRAVVGFDPERDMIPGRNIIHEHYRCLKNSRYFILTHGHKCMIHCFLLLQLTKFFFYWLFAFGCNLPATVVIATLLVFWDPKESNFFTSKSYYGFLPNLQHSFTLRGSTFSLLWVPIS